MQSQANKKNIAIISLLILLTIAVVGWLNAPKELSSDIQDQTKLFYGHDAYLDQEIENVPVSGDSMEPTFKSGDTLLAVEVDNVTKLETGDIIIYQHSGKPIAHRIVDIQKQDGNYRFKTRADKYPSEEYWVSEEDVHALVIGVIYSE